MTKSLPQLLHILIFGSQALNTAPLPRGLSPSLRAQSSLPALLLLSILRVPVQPGKNFVLSAYNGRRKAGGDKQAVTGEMKMLKGETCQVHPQLSTSLVKLPWEDG